MSTVCLKAGSKYNISLLDRALTLQLGSDTVTASDHVRVLGVSVSSDVSLKKHVSKTCAVAYTGFDSCGVSEGHLTTHEHAFVTSRVDYCNAVYAGAPKTITDKLQRVLKRYCPRGQ